MDPMLSSPAVAAAHARPLKRKHRSHHALDNPFHVNFLGDALGNAVIYRDDLDGGRQVDFVKTVARMEEMLLDYLVSTPQYNYELLSEMLQCDCYLKLENLQEAGDMGTRLYLSILLSNFLQQQHALGFVNIEQASGIVLVMYETGEDQQISNSVLATAIAVHKFLAIPITIFVSEGVLNLLALTQIECLMQIQGTRFVIKSMNGQETIEAARNFALENSMVFVEPAHNPQFMMIGAATVGCEMMRAQAVPQCIIIPMRTFERGWATVSGIAYYCKMVEPTIRVVVASMTDFNRQILFPDILETSWITSIYPSVSLNDTYYRIESDKGIIGSEDIYKVFEKIPKGSANLRLADYLTDDSSSLNFTQFNNIYHSESDTSEKTAMQRFNTFFGSLEIEKLLENHLLDEVASITENEAVHAFLRVLEYTRTTADGKGSLALASLLFNKVKVHSIERAVCLVTGGNIEPQNFDDAIDYGLGIMGQYFSMDVLSPDDSESISKVMRVLAENQVSVKDVTFDRTLLHTPRNFVLMKFQCGCRSFAQQHSVERAIKELGFDISLQRNPETLRLPPLRDVNYGGVGEPKSDEGETQNQPSNEQKAGRTIQEMTPESIEKAFNRIKCNLFSTPLYQSEFFSDLCGAQVYLFLENIQKTGSFKIRGSSNMVLKSIEASPNGTRPNGIVASSAGNHAQGVALVALKTKIPCTIVCPSYAPETKLAFTRRYNAEVIKVGDSLEVSAKAAKQICKDRGWMLVEPFNDIDVIEGQGTIGYEMFRRMQDIDTVLVGVGGGGLISGIASYLKARNPKIRIVGVQSELVSPLADIKKTGEFRYIPPKALTLADGTNVKKPGGVHTSLLRTLVDEYVTVTENEIASTIVHLLHSTRTLAEGAGCLTLAALLHKKVKVRPDEKVCALICGGNIDITTLRQVYEYGLRSMGKSFSVEFSFLDGHGMMSKLTENASKAKLKIRQIRHVRGEGDLAWNYTKVSMQFWSHSFKHQVRFLNLCVDDGFSPVISSRNYIIDHEQRYAAFDEKCKQKMDELSRITEQEKADFARMNHIIRNS
eukprot:TRINITY_DN3135_c0_g1_i1.p1 TRINITY_DN3135_c0_g1~~TRINITY_DN3135_c0_g1_i1.p1  ORF type:complete len:1056 (-),score=245.73 TRINITY_DN3135_c0_g1_i1:63-3230(-)